MGLWSQRVVPRLVDRVLSSTQHAEIRARVCAGLSGEVLELGFGSGLNLPHLPPAVTSVIAVEPSDVGWSLSGRRRAGSPVPVRRAGLDGQRLPLPDASVDSVLSTWTMCTIPDPLAALREVHRVLRPGGQLRFVEHGAAPDPGVLRWQHRLDPLQRRLAAGCQLSRPVDVLLAQARLPAQELARYYAAGEPRPFAHLYEGSSVRAG